MASADTSLFISHLFFTFDLKVFFESMGLDQGLDSSGGGASFSTFFKALKIELKIPDSFYGFIGRVACGPISLPYQLGHIEGVFFPV
jgi:hypothetical protein